MQSGSTPKVQDYFSDVAAPETEQLSYQLEQLVQQGTLTPEQAQAYLVENSAMGNVNQNAETKDAQMAALQGLQDISNSGGLTAMDKQKINQISTQEQSQARGARDAILSNAQARGVSGSGLELMSQMQNQQESANRVSSRNMDVSAMAQERALNALMQQGQLAGQMGSQQFNQDAQKANSQDAISQFNAQNKQQVGMANTNSANQAQAANLGAKQSIADTNAATRNAQAAQRANVAQQQYENELKKRQLQSGVATTNAASAGANSQAKADASNKTTGTFVTAASMFMSDERCKKDIEEFNPSDFLDSLTSYKYNYKNQKHGKGQQAGVMAQDLEKTEIGSSLVEETEDGKAINTTKATGPILASLSNINERLKKMEGK